MMEQKAQMLRIAMERLGGTTTEEGVGRVLDLLLDERVITPRRMRRAVIRHEFFRRLADKDVTGSALDIEMDLAAEYGVSVRSVQMFRSEHRHNKMK